VNARISRSVKTILDEDAASGRLPEELRKRWAGKKIPSIRSCVSAPEGMVFVESDYCTAEIVGLILSLTY